MNTATVRCKMRIQSVTLQKSENGTIESETVTLQAVTSNSPENKEWSKWTPSANFTMQINNQAAMNKLTRGHEYYVDLIPVAEDKIDAPNTI